MARISATKLVRFDRAAELRPASTGACAVCGEARKGKASFCAGCGHAYEAVRRGARPYSPARGRPGVWRRILAELIDRLAPLPFLAWFWPEWTLVVVAYHLLCGATPAGRSPGKAVCRLCIISLDSLEPCGLWRGVARRLGVAAAQALYCRWEWVPLALLYDLVSLLLVRLHPAGRRAEDVVLHTQVITAAAFRAMRQRCSSCGELVLQRSRYCPFCGVSQGNELNIEGAAREPLSWRDSK